MKVNFAKRTIVLSNKEMQQASKPYSQEYTMLVRIMRDLPGFEIEVKHNGFSPNANRGLTYTYMERYIAQNAPEMYDEFCSVRSAYGYPVTTKWFRETFPCNNVTVDLCSMPQTAA